MVSSKPDNNEPDWLKGMKMFQEGGKVMELNSKGFQSYQNGQHDQALEYFKESLRISPNKIIAKNIATIHKVHGKNDLALHYLDEALKLDPTDESIKAEREKLVSVPASVPKNPADIAAEVLKGSIIGMHEEHVASIEQSVNTLKKEIEEIERDSARMRPSEQKLHKVSQDIQELMKRAQGLAGANASASGSSPSSSEPRDILLAKHDKLQLQSNILEAKISELNRSGKGNSSQAEKLKMYLEETKRHQQNILATLRSMT